jgi:RNA polymerase sigma factor (sigma-70 family)
MRSPSQTLLDHLRRLTRPPVGDAALLSRWVRERHEDAFAALVARHGPMVFGVCRRILGDGPDAEDAFQAVFLILARKAASLRRPEALAGWLHGVAARLAWKARAARRRDARSRPLAVEPADVRPDPLDLVTVRELLALFDREIGELPEVYRLPVVLCDLEGRTQEGAAEMLGWTLGSLRGRLLRGRARLKTRLARRGLTLPVGIVLPLIPATLAASSQAAVPVLTPQAIAAASRCAVRFAAHPATAEVPARAADLARDGLRVLMLGKVKIAAAMIVMMSVCLAGAGLMALRMREAKPADERREDTPPSANAAPKPVTEKPSVRLDRFGDALPPGAIARLGTIRFRGNTTTYVAFSPDGKSVAGAGGCGIVYLWDAVAGKELHRFSTASGIGVMAVSPKGKQLAASGGAAELFDMATGKRLHELGNGRRRGVICALAFAPDGKVLVAATDNAADPIMVWDVVAGKYLRAFEGKPGPIISLTYSPDGKHLASCGQDKIIRVWDADTGRERGRLEGHEKDITSLAFADSGKLLASAGMDQTIRIWDVASRKEIHRLEEKHGGVKALAVSPDGRMLACGNEDGTIGSWEMRRVRELQHWKADVFAISSLAFAPDGKSLASGTRQGCCPRQWDMATGRELRVFGGHRSTVNWLSFSPDGRQVLSAAYEKTALRWDLRSGREERWFSWPTEHFDHFLLSPDRKSAVTLGFEWGGDGVVRLWDTTTGKEQRILGRVKAKELGIMNHPAAFSPDGKLLAAGSGDGTVFLWEVTTGKECGRWDKLSGCINDLVFSPDGKGLAAATWELGQRTLRYWDVATGKDLCHFESRGRVGNIAFAPDGKLLASAGLDDDKDSRDYLIGLWDVATGKRLRTLETVGDPNGVLGTLAFSPDSRFLAASQGWFDNAPICVWEAATGREVCRFGRHSSLCSSLCFSPDGRSLASGGNDSVILLWDLTGRRKGDGLQPAVLTDRQLATSWQELAGGDAGRAYRAAWLLASDTERTVPFLQRQWRSLLAADEKRIARQIADLDSEQLEVRERVTAELEKHGLIVLPELRHALEGGPPLELRRRVEQIREKLDGQLLRLRRVLLVLEQTGSTPARELLADIANRKLDDRLTHEAKAALHRVQTRALRR